MKLFSVLGLITFEKATLWAISSQMVIGKHGVLKSTKRIQLVGLSDSVTLEASTYDCIDRCRMKDHKFTNS